MQEAKRRGAKNKRRAREVVLIELNKIYNTDCLEFMRSMPDSCVDLVVTDPPYEISTKGGGLGKRPVYENGALDKISQGFDVEATLEQIARVCKKVNIFIFCSTKQKPRLSRITPLKAMLRTSSISEKRA